MNNKSILITGASDGIGKALAMEMAKRSYDLALTARRLDKLEQLQQEIIKRYPQVRVEIAVLDVTDIPKVEPVIMGLRDVLGKLDIVLANAGIAHAGKMGQTPIEEHLSVINTNVNGAMATLSAGLKVFREQGFGHLVGTSSVAAYRGLPKNAAYSASKAALSTLMEAIRVETLTENIDVTVLHPGFIDTEINRKLDNRPFVIQVEKGAEIFAQLIERKVKRSAVPVMPWCIVAPLLKILPSTMIARM